LFNRLKRETFFVNCDEIYQIFLTKLIILCLTIYMPVRKKSKPTRRVKSPIIVIYRYIIISVVIVLAGTTLAGVFTNILGGQVLGVKTLMARSDNARGSSGQGEFRGPKVEQGEVFERTVPAGNSGKENVMFVRPQKQEVEDEIEVEDEDLEVNIATDGGNLKHRGAISHFPISINPATGEMTITTPAGTKVVTVLPDQAVENMLTKGIISKIGGHIATGSGDLGEDDSSASATIQSEDNSLQSVENVELTEENGVPVYKINGQKEKRFFGIIPVTIDKTVTVSAETGELESQQLSPFERIIDLLSI